MMRQRHLRAAGWMVACALTACTGASGKGTAAAGVTAPAPTNVRVEDETHGSISVAAGASILEFDDDGRSPALNANEPGVSIRGRGTLGLSRESNGTAQRHVQLELGPELGVSIRRTSESEHARTLDPRADSLFLMNASLFMRSSLHIDHLGLGLFFSPGIGHRSAVSKEEHGKLVTRSARTGLWLSSGVTLGYVTKRPEASDVEVGLSCAVAWFVASGESAVGLNPEFYVSF